MKYFDQHGYYGCIIDVIAFDQTINGVNLPSPIKDHDGILICHENIYNAYLKTMTTVNNSVPFSMISKGAFNYGIDIAKKVGNVTLKYEALIELKELTEEKSKLAKSNYGIINISGKDMVIIKPEDYESNTIFTSFDNYTSVPIDYTFTRDDKLLIPHTNFLQRVKK